VDKVLLRDLIRLFPFRAWKTKSKGIETLRVTLDWNGIAARFSHYPLAIKATLTPSKRKLRRCDPSRNSATTQASLSTQQQPCFLKLSTWAQALRWLITLLTLLTNRFTSYLQGLYRIAGSRGRTANYKTLKEQLAPTFHLVLTNRFTWYLQVGLYKVADNSCSRLANEERFFFLPSILRR
jgi:hypothetical protein